jgi:hypothetical protein
MENCIKPLHLTPHFPSYSPVFFGQVLRGKEEDYEKGYAIFTAKYPHQTDLVRLSLGDREVCTSFAPHSSPILEDLSFSFKSRVAAEARLVHQRIGEEVDMFFVEGHPLMIMEEEEKGYRLHNTNVLLQVLDFYSRFLRKSIKALEKVDNRAARQAVLSIAQDLKKTEDLSERIELEERLQEAFTCLAIQVAEEAN